MTNRTCYRHYAFLVNVAWVDKCACNFCIFNKWCGETIFSFVLLWYLLNSVCVIFKTEKEHADHPRTILGVLVKQKC